MNDTKDTASSPLLLVGKLLLGLGLITVIVLLASGLREREAAPGFSEGTKPQVRPTAQPGAVSPFQQAIAAKGFLSVRVVVPRITVYTTASQKAKVLKVFPTLDQYQMPTTFLVNQELSADDGTLWYRVLVPMPPSGTMGWIRASEVQAIILTHSVRISLSAHRLDLYDRGTLVKSYPVGVGKTGTRTPTGEFYYTTKVRPSDPKGIYGVLAIGISAYSETLTDWPGGGQVGIHGTNDDKTIGTDVSHGCVRLHNKDIVALNELTRLGTPVSIVQ